MPKKEVRVKLESKKKAEKKKFKKKAARPRKIGKSNKEVAMDFAQAVHQKFDRLIKASILFGSQAKDTATPDSDIDIVLIIDDASIEWDLPLMAWYREELGKIIAAKAKGMKREFHINTIKLTTWWLDLLHGDPVIINIIRYGEGLIDSGGFYHPIKALLLKGKIKSTPEAAYAALQRAPTHLARSRAAEMGAIEGVYWAMVDSAQAALITAGKVPPSPEHIPVMLKETFVDSGSLKVGYISAFRDLYIIHKSIEHSEVNDIRGVEIDKWQKIADDFVVQMTKIINQILEE